MVRYQVRFDLDNPRDHRFTHELLVVAGSVEIYEIGCFHYIRQSFVIIDWNGF